MSSSQLAILVLVVVFALSTFATFRIRRRLLASPGGLQRVKSLPLFAAVTLFAFLVLNAYLHPGRQQLVLLAVFAVLILLLAHQALKSPTPQETLRQYSLTPGRCGRCDYDLTGNVTGVCPECGWKIPDGTEPQESPEWPLWWKRWPIDHLDNWKRAYALCLFNTAMFAAVAVGLVWRTGPNPFAALPLLMSLHFALNAGRVRAFGRRGNRRPH